MTESSVRRAFGSGNINSVSNRLLPASSAPNNPDNSQIITIGKKRRAFDLIRRNNASRVTSATLNSLAHSGIACLHLAMIAFLRGQLTTSTPHQAIVDVHGVGYLVQIPLSTFDRLPQAGADVTLLTHYHVTDRDHTLFGFMSADERDLFRLLIDRVSGIGPKMALSVLSGMPVTDFKDAVIRNDVKALARIKGVGTKTAERIVLELKDKVGVVDAWQAANTARVAHDPLKEAQMDAVLGLIALGYKQSEAQKAVNEIVKQSGFVATTPADKIIREALRVMN